MKITVEQREGEDYPRGLKSNPNWHKEVEKAIRRRLQLRDKDIVEIVEV